MNILLDSLSVQVMIQQTPPNQRLNTLLGAMQSIGQSTSNPWNVSFSTSPITPEQLEGIDVYVSFTRDPSPQNAYHQSELDALQEFVNNGYGILLMSNHGPFKNNPKVWPTNDIPLAAMFGITIEPFGVSLNNFMVMTMDEAPDFIGYQVNGIVSHDSCIIVPPDNFTSLAQFPEGAKQWDPATNSNIDPVSPFFSILVPFGAGNVIVTGNSGMFTDYGTTSPSCGMIPFENNLMFFLNCLAFLNNPNASTPIPGKCPSA